MLGPPLSLLFDHPVDIEPPVLLQQPAEGDLETRGVPAPPPEAPLPQDITPPEEVPVEVEPLPTSPVLPGLNGTAAEGNETALAPVASPSPALPNATGNGTNATAPLTDADNTTAPVASPSPLPSPSPSPLPSDIVVIAPSPSPAVQIPLPPASPAPAKTKQQQQQESWDKAPPCQFEPTGANSTPDKQGRLWGWIGSTSCAFKSSSGKTAITTTWDTARDCSGTATTANSVYDSAGRLWGWQENNSCAYRGQRQQAPGLPGQKLVTWEEAPACKGVPWGSNAVRGADGQLWGYENGSCAFRHHHMAITWAAAPVCVGVPLYYKIVFDSVNRPWGFENGRSCKIL